MPGAPSLGPVSLWPSSPLPFLRNCPRETRRGQLESQTLALCAKHCAGICPQATASQPDAEPQPRRPRLVPRRPRLPRAPCCGLCDGSPGASRGQAPRLPHSAGPCTEQALQAELERDPGAEALCGPRSFELSEKVPALLFLPRRRGWLRLPCFLFAGLAAQWPWDLCPAGPPNDLPPQKDGRASPRPGLRSPHLQPPPCSGRCICQRGFAGPLSPQQGSALRLGLCNLTL